MIDTKLTAEFNPVIFPTLQACKQTLAKHYSHQLQGVILFGSAARQEMTSESDIDLLVLLAQPLNYFEELSTIVEVLYPLQLETSHWISAKPADSDEFAAGTIQLCRNIQEEGIFL